jgi:hemin uptake protein HemP
VSDDTALPGARDLPMDADASPGPDARPGRIESAHLLGRARELVILHAGREYRLRITQNGKLILTA